MNVIIAAHAGYSVCFDSSGLLRATASGTRPGYHLEFVDIVAGRLGRADRPLHQTVPLFQIG